MGQESGTSGYNSFDFYSRGMRINAVRPGFKVNIRQYITEVDGATVGVHIRFLTIRTNSKHWFQAYYIHLH